MSIPQVTCNADIVDVAASVPRLCQLGATATQSPTAWRWEMLEVPTGSTANVGSNGDFTDGVATVQNPQFTADTAGGTYVLQAQASNATGWSDPDVDRASGQQPVVIRTSDLGMPVPGARQYNWDDYLNECLDLLETAASGGSVPSHAASHQDGGADEISVAGLSGALADPQTPTSHASSHQSGGADAIKIDNLASPDDNTDLDATASAHGLLPKLSGNASHALKGDGTWGAVAGGSPLTTKGDVYTYSTVDARLGVGSNGQVLTADSAEATGLKWAASASAQLDYLSTTQPTGASAPEAVYQFDGTGSTLNDRTGNGHTLSLASGVTRYTQWNSDIRGFYFNGSSRLSAALSSALHFTGAKTIEVMYAVDVLTNFQAPVLMEPVPTSESEADNILYHLFLNSTTGEISYQHETTSAANIQEISSYVLPAGLMGLWTVTVDSAGTGIKFYWNGTLIHSNTLSGAAVNGSNGVLQIGLNCKGVLPSARITGSEYTAAQVLEAAQQVGLA